MNLFMQSEYKKKKTFKRLYRNKNVSFLKAVIDICRKLSARAIFIRLLLCSFFFLFLCCAPVILFFWLFP